MLFIVRKNLFITTGSSAKKNLHLFFGENREKNVYQTNTNQSFHFFLEVRDLIKSDARRYREW